MHKHFAKRCDNIGEIFHIFSYMWYLCKFVYTYIHIHMEGDQKRERKRGQRRQKESCLRAGRGQATDGVGVGDRYVGGRINDIYI